MVYITSTFSSTTALRRTLMEMQTDLARGQKELSTGRHADMGQSLGSGVGRDHLLGGARDHIDAIVSTNKLVNVRLDATQSALSSLSSSAQALRATLIAAQNDGGNPVAIETQAKTALAAFVATLNSSDGNSFIFAGVNSDTAPMTDYFATPPAASKTALDAAFAGAFGMTQSSAAVSTISPAPMQGFLSGAMAGLFAPAGWSANWSSAANTPLQSQISMSLTIDTSVTANDPALQKLAMAYTALSDLGISKMNAATYQTVVQTATQTIDQAIDGLTKLQTTVGVMQSNVASATQTMSIQSGLLQSHISDLESVDPTEAATRVNGLMTQIETSYALTARITQLSLTKYL